MGYLGGRFVSGHEFTRAGPEFTRVIKSSESTPFLTAVGWRAAPAFGAKRPKNLNTPLPICIAAKVPSNALPKPHWPDAKGLHHRQNVTGGPFLQHAQLPYCYRRMAKQSLSQSSP